MIFLLAAITLLWDAGPETVEKLKRAGVENIAVPQTSATGWATISAIKADPVDTSAAIKLPTPAMKMRSNVAGATRSPWIDSNGWRILRDRGKRFAYHAPGRSAALAYAEAFVFDADAYIETDVDGLEHFGRMHNFCTSGGASRLPPAANIGVIDDRSVFAGEILNLLVRRNLLFKIVDKPDPKLGFNLNLATYTKPDEKDPSAIAQRIRAELGDDKRLVRVYGTEVVIARILTDGKRSRLYLLNYSTRPVEGLRVRVLGRWPKHSIRSYAVNEPKALDFTTDASSTEFTIPELPMLAIIDLEN